MGGRSCLLSGDVARLARAFDAHSRATGAPPLDATRRPGGDRDAARRPGGDGDAAVLEEMHRRLRTPPGREDLWVDLPFVARDRPLQAHLRASVFRPEMPPSWHMNSHEWLSNRDIHQAMRQYEDRCPDFAFLGVFPIDFAAVLEDGKCVAVEMCRLDVGRLWSQGRRHLGVVFNTDKHHESGSHWVCCYVGLDPSPRARHFGVFYYDSVCQPPPAEVRRFGEELRQQVSRVHGPRAADRFVFHTNRVRRQFKNTECGVFAMLFIVCCLAGRLGCEDICRAMGTDEHVHRMRSVFFRENGAVARRAFLSDGAGIQEIPTESRTPSVSRPT